MRVIHIVESLDRGAVENWLLRMLKHAQLRAIPLDWTFYCTLPDVGAWDDEARALGATVIHSPVPLSDKRGFFRALRRELRSGRYDVLHCHHDLVSAFYLLAALGLPMRRRLVHVHNADEGVLTANRLKQFLYREPMRRFCLAMADRIVGISDYTLDSFLAGRPRRAGRDSVHYYGVDVVPAAGDGLDPLAFRRDLGLASDSRILLFAGRIVDEKNPLFAVDVLAKLKQLDPKAVAVFVGSGALSDAVEKHVAEKGLEKDFRALGWRNDVQAIMRCCDWFILPRPEQPKEGFGLAVVEAQLAGLRLLLSQGITDAPLLPTAVCRRLPLNAGPNVWAEAAVELYVTAVSSQNAASALARSPMDMDTALQNLADLHGLSSANAS